MAKGGMVGRSERRKEVVESVAPVAFGAVVDSASLVFNDVQAGDVFAAGCVVRADVAGSKFSSQCVFRNVVLSLNLLLRLKL